MEVCGFAYFPLWLEVWSIFRYEETVRHSEKVHGKERCGELCLNNISWIVWRDEKQIRITSRYIVAFSCTCNIHQKSKTLLISSKLDVTKSLWISYHSMVSDGIWNVEKVCISKHFFSIRCHLPMFIRIYSISPFSILFFNISTIAIIDFALDFLFDFFMILFFIKFRKISIHFSFHINFSNIQSFCIS